MLFILWHLKRSSNLILFLFDWTSKFVTAKKSVIFIKKINCMLFENVAVLFIYVYIICSFNILILLVFMFVNFEFGRKLF